MLSSKAWFRPTPMARICPRWLPSHPSSFPVSIPRSTRSSRRLAPSRPKGLEGKAAVANARLAYELFEKKFAEDSRWAALEAKGAKKQRPLWASTGTKNAAYSDVKYVDELVAKDVVNTMPEKTLLAVADHGKATLGIIPGNYDEAHDIMNDLAEVGINFKDVTDKLEADGVAAFIKSWIRCSPMSSPASTVSTADFD